MKIYSKSFAMVIISSNRESKSDLYRFIFVFWTKLPCLISFVFWIPRFKFIAIIFNLFFQARLVRCTSMCGKRFILRRPPLERIGTWGSYRGCYFRPTKVAIKVKWHADPEVEGPCVRPPAFFNLSFSYSWNNRGSVVRQLVKQSLTL